MNSQEWFQFMLDNGVARKSVTDALGWKKRVVARRIASDEEVEEVIKRVGKRMRERGLWPWNPAKTLNGKRHIESEVNEIRKIKKTAAPMSAGLEAFARSILAGK